MQDVVKGHLEEELNNLRRVHSTEKAEYERRIKELQDENARIRREFEEHMKDELERKLNEIYAETGAEQDRLNRRVKELETTLAANDAQHKDEVDKLKRNYEQSFKNSIEAHLKELVNDYER